MSHMNETNDLEPLHRRRPIDRGMKTHLGDGVYADFDGFMVVMTTENGIEVTNTIYLEPEVLAALDLYREQLKTLPKLWSPNHQPPPAS